MIRLTLSFAFAISTCLLSMGELDAQTGKHFRIGGKTPGQVTVQLNGGAGANPRFQIGGQTATQRISNRRFVANSFPVAVGGYGNGCCGNNYFGDGGFTNLYNQGFIPVPPYFALHPPVYYSAPVPRSYGYSPFPYPGTVPTPEVVMGPEEIINPHVDPDANGEEVPVPPQEQEASQRTARVSPEVIRNPFVEQAQIVSLTADVDSNR